jgi:spore maturation protein CgeB
VLSNSEGGLERLRELGARRAENVPWAADPEFFRPFDVEKEYDVFFYGYGDKFRREWTGQMVGEPSRALPEADFALGGRDFRGDTGLARLVGDVPFNAFTRAISAARINLCITRRSHATVYASSSCRPFELAAAGAAIVANPYEGIERWFEPGSELLVVSSAEEATAAYRDLLADPGQAEALGRRARDRVLDEHTYLHRARQLLSLLGVREAAIV